MSFKALNSVNTFINTIKGFFLLLDTTDKKKALVMLLIIFVGTFLEMLSLGLIFPTMQLVLNENFISDYSFFINIKKNFNFTENALIIFILLLLIFVFLIKNILLILIIIFRAKFIENLRRKLTEKLYSKYLNQNFSFFINKNTSELIRNIHQEVSKTVQGIDGMIIFFTEIFILMGMGAVLLYLSPYATSIIIIVTLLIFLSYISLTKKKIFEIGKNDQTLFSALLKESQQGFNNFKEIFIYQLRDTFLLQFSKILVVYCKNNRILAILQQIPRIFFEQIGVILIIGIAIIIFLGETDKTKSLAIIGVYAYAFFKVLPSVNKLIVSVQLFVFVKPSLNIVHEELKKIVQESQKINITDSIKFEKNINLQNINYTVENENKVILKDINLIIKKNSKVGIIGETGSGKSTLLNIVMGLIKPTSGNIKVDEKILNDLLINWRKKISFVSQSTYLLDESILNNITFHHNYESVNVSKLEKAINIACLKEYVDSLNLKLDTIVGERGSKISGGELQRICIARAVYNDSEILILDEFTSALDKKTQSQIIENIFKLNKTIIVASHRLSTLKYCDEVYEVSKNKLKKIK